MCGLISVADAVREDARAAVEGACLNVLINLGSVTDDAFKTVAREEVDRLRKEAERLAKELQARMREVLQA